MVIESMSDGMFVLDPNDLIVDINPAAPDIRPINQTRL
jgi:PAS domain-containing protein